MSLGQGPVSLLSCLFCLCEPQCSLNPSPDWLQESTKDRGHLGYRGGHILEIKSKRILEVNTIKSKIPLDVDVIHILAKLEQRYHKNLKGKEIKPSKTDLNMELAKQSFNFYICTTGLNSNHLWYR